MPSSAGCWLKYITKLPQNVISAAAFYEVDEMEYVNLRLATESDVPEIMAVMTAAHEAMADPSAYITDEEEYVADHVNNRGFILLSEIAHKIAGFFLVSVPELGESNLGYYLNFSKDQLLHTALMDSVAVRPEYQGMGLMGQMLRAAVVRTQDRYAWLLATVAPDNIPSLRNFEKCGFQTLKLIVKPQGQQRLLMGKSKEMASIARKPGACL